MPGAFYGFLDSILMNIEMAFNVHQIYFQNINVTHNK